MSNETEVQGGSPNLAEVVKYIAERSANIKGASDKLRDNILLIARMLHPAIEGAGITHIGKTFETYTNDYYHYDYQLVIGKPWGWDLYVVQTCQEDPSQEATPYSLDSVKRFLLVAIVKELPTFLQAYTEVLQEKESKYNKIAEIAERMAQAISS
jgi:hypothetical protein